MITKKISFAILILTLTSTVFAGSLEDSAVAYMKSNEWEIVKIVKIVNKTLIIEIPPFRKKISLEEPSFSHFSDGEKCWAKVDGVGKVKFILNKYGKKYDTVFLKQKSLKSKSP